MSSKTIIRYNFEDFVKYQKVNNFLPPQLSPYVIQNKNINNNFLSNFENTLGNIINSITVGDDPNDIIYKNMVKFNINTINNNSYNEVLTNLKTLDTPPKIHFMINEIILCIIRCPQMCKNTEIDNLKNNSTPELCCELLKDFTNFVPTFSANMLSILQKIFLDFFDKNKFLDENNSYNSDLYKSFMTLLGMLYFKKLLPNSIITFCITKIISEIFPAATIADQEKICSRNNTECVNYFKGYDFLLNFVLTTLEYNLKSKTSSENKVHIKTYAALLLEQHKSITEYNSVYKCFDNKQNIVVPLRQHIIITHNLIMSRIEKIMTMPIS